MGRKLPPTNGHMTSRAMELRQGSFTPERLLWSKLRNANCCGLRFRRQQPVGPYVVDFLCTAARLVIELDGRSHDERAVQDVKGQEFLERQAWTVIRINNDRVLADLEGVAQAIAGECEKRLDALRKNPHSFPSPKGEG